VFYVGWNVQIRAPLKYHGFKLALELHGGTPLQDKHPFIVVLVIPETWRGGMA
jgi:hypothetical protein